MIEPEDLDAYGLYLKELYDAGQVITSPAATDLLAIQKLSEPEQVKVIAFGDISQDQTSEIAKRAYVATATEATAANSYVKKADLATDTENVDGVPSALVDGARASNTFTVSGDGWFRVARLGGQSSESPAKITIRVIYNPNGTVRDSVDIEGTMGSFLEWKKRNIDTHLVGGRVVYDQTTPFERYLEVNFSGVSTADYTLISQVVYGGEWVDPALELYSGALSSGGGLTTSMSTKYDNSILEIIGTVIGNGDKLQLAIDGNGKCLMGRRGAQAEILSGWSTGTDVTSCDVEVKAFGEDRGEITLSGQIVLGSYSTAGPRTVGVITGNPLSLGTDILYPMRAPAVTAGGLRTFLDFGLVYNGTSTTIIMYDAYSSAASGEIIDLRGSWAL
jgi:hypothetical protein